MTTTQTTNESKTMTKQYTNAVGTYFLTRHKVTEIYSVCEKRFVGSSKVSYWLSTKSNLKACFSNMGEAVAEAIRRQEWIDQKAAA